MLLSTTKFFFDFCRLNFDSFPVKDGENVAVVSFFGKSLQETFGVKYHMFKKFKQKTDSVNDSNKACFIEGCYDPNENVVYLHLKGVLDIHSLIETLNKMSTFLTDKGQNPDNYCMRAAETFASARYGPDSRSLSAIQANYAPKLDPFSKYLTTWANLKHEYARCLIFLFSVSHIVVVCHPVPVFDLSYIHLFKALEVVRQRGLKKLKNSLSDVSGLAKEWCDMGRPCSPRMLFRFETCPRGIKDVKKLEHALEDQIYHILRKCRIISNVSTSSLFAIPMNQEFVFIETENNRPAAGINKMVNNVIYNCTDVQPRVSVLEYLTVEHELKEVQKTHTFQKFLAAHVELALSKGFDDNVGRHLAPAPFALISIGNFFAVARRAYSIFVDDEYSENASPEDSFPKGDTDLFDALRDHLDIDTKFSEARCAKVLPLALATYQQNSPFHYTREYHESRLAQAMTVLVMHGRGSMVDKYADQLEKECLKHWQNGRQMCQVLSLTGHPCTNAIHKCANEEWVIDPTPAESNNHQREGLEVKEHSSGVRFLSACNCGRRQAPRSDPYTLRAANYDFYTLLAEECGCDQFDVVRFPIFQPSSEDFKAAQVLNRRENMQKSDVSKTDLGVDTPQEPYNSVYVSGQSGAGSDVTAEPRLSCNQSETRATDQEIVIHVSNNAPLFDKDKMLARQPSTTEYLPTMLHTESPAGLLPRFSSWSLVCLGPSSLYSHNLGLQDQPGIISGSSYLLPWDVTIRLEHERRSTWANMCDYRKNHMMRARKNKGDQSEFVVKIFIGVEYECPRGHRFMAAGPDKILKTSNCGQVKDTGQMVTSADMPLYFPCVCRSNKPTVAQLMRIHMVTPKAPVRVTLNPRVQPCPNAPIFIACTEQPIALTQSAYWVLRLPYVYMGERGPYMPPQEYNESSQGRFLSGCYGITEIPTQAS